MSTEAAAAPAVDPADDKTAPPSSNGSDKAKLPKVPTLLRQDFPYTHGYCEENIYKLFERMILMQQVERAKGVHELYDRFDKMYAVFLSNYTHSRKNEVENDWQSVVPVRVSRSERDPEIFKYSGKESCVTWDYHVVGLVHAVSEGSNRPAQWYVVDFDTRHPTVPVEGSLLIPFARYIKETFDFTDLYDKIETPSTRMNPKRLQRAAADVRCRVLPALSLLSYMRSDRSHMQDKKGKFLMTPPAYAAIDGASPVARRLRKGEDEAALNQKLKPEFKNNLATFINQVDEDALTPMIGKSVALSELPAYVESL